MPADGSSPAVPLVTGPKSDSTARFLPDGQRFVFISSRSGTPQVYEADFHQASHIGLPSPWQITNFAEGVQAPLVISPDGSSIAVVSDVYPDCKDEACNKAKMDAEENDPVKVRELTHLLFRHWDEWRLHVRHHIFVVPIAASPAGSWPARDITPGDFDSPPTQDEDGNVSFSPDGKSIAFVSNREGGDREAFTTNKDVWIVPVAGGDPKNLTKANLAADDQAVWSPDGKTIAMRSQRRAGFESDRFYLELYDVATGAHRTAFESPDLSVSEFTWARDGASLLFTAPSNGLDNLYSVLVNGGRVTTVFKGGSVSQLHVTSGAIVFAKSSLVAPADVVLVPEVACVTETVSAGIAPVPEPPCPIAPRALTHENAAWTSNVAFETPEAMTVPGAGGTPVQYWVIKPPNFDATKKYPVVFMIHGGPQGEWGDSWSYRWNPSLWAAQGWVVVAPNPRGSFGFGQQFTDEISKDWGGRVMTDLTAVFDAAIKLPYVDATRQGIAGASYGGYAVDWILGHTNRFKVAVTHDGVFNLESMTMTTEELWFGDWEFGGAPWTPEARANFAKWSPHLFAQNIKTPTLIITNEQDFRVPVDQGLQMFTVLRRNNVPSKALSFPDEGHWVLKALNSQRWHEEVFAWMKTYLK